MSAVVGLLGGMGTAQALLTAPPVVTVAPPAPAPSATGSPPAAPAPLGVPALQDLTVAADRAEVPTGPTAPPIPPPPDPIAPTVDAAGLSLADREAGLLSTLVPASASGELAVVPGAEPAPVVDRPVRTVRVEVEVGLEIDPVLFAGTVMTTLNDPRGWGADGSVTFARTDGEADLRVVLASPTLTDALCAPLETVGLYSCGTAGHAVLNHTRWVAATPEFVDRQQYRQYLVNHEVGHLLGHRHVQCPAAGTVAPIMQQQTIGVAPCLPNGWPYP